MKGAFICNKTENIKKVYSVKTREAIASRLTLLDGVITASELEERSRELTEIDFIFSTWGMPKLPAEFIKQHFPSLKAVFYGAGTVQGFAEPFLQGGIRVTSAYRVNAVPVSEYAASLTVLANKGFFRSTALIRKGDGGYGDSYIAAKAVSKAYPGNYGAPVGILGIGAVGSLTVSRLRSFGLTVYGFDPFLPQERADALGVILSDIDEIFSRCGVVINCLANNAQTKGMINARLLSALPANATFINVGRGAQVIENDLVDFLTARRDAVAILDVTSPEPPDENSLLFRLDNVILSPHSAGSQSDEQLRMGEEVLSQLCLFLENKPIPGEVTLPMLKTMA